MENQITSEILDLSKENVQPLRHGRRAAQLSTALQAELSPGAQKQLDEEREQYEMMICMYEGDDPVEPRYNFMHWIEQSYPKLGPNSKYLPLLEDTINLFRDDSRYRQDKRFIEILVKYINLQANPLELYQLAYNQGLGTMCAIFYRSWAEELDQNQDWKRANQIYEIGIMNRAEPLDELKMTHEQFQLSVGRRLINGESPPPGHGEGSVVAPPRQALTKIKKAQVAGTRRPQGDPGIFRSQPFVTHNRQKTPIAIYQENNEENLIGGSTRSQLDHFPKAVITNKENSLKAGPWKNKGSSRSSSSAAAAAKLPSAPSFHVHEDKQEENINYQTPIVPRALKHIKQSDVDCPVAIFEKPDETKKAMYPKNKVYVGGREFQLEEIMAAFYNKHHNQDHGGKESYEFQTPLLQFGRMNLADRSASAFAPEGAGGGRSTPQVNAQVRLFAGDHSDGSDVEDETDSNSIRYYRNEKNLMTNNTDLS